ncbi:MAG: hypothetical protein K9L62_04445 [Vallitaleaceae bacterium]|nr:hypothetical protein [Vallitaleaceae bacterium]
MKLLINGLSIVTMLMLFSTIVCGFWIKSNQIVEKSSIQFHAVMGSISAILTIILLIVLMITIKKVA